MAAKRGRPTKRNAEVEAKILEALSAGNYLETAARFAGIHPDTLNEWRKHFPEFSEAVDKARAQSEVRNVAIVQRSGQAGDWRASAWWLERSFPERYGRRDRHELEHSGKVGLTLTQLIELAEDGDER